MQTKPEFSAVDDEIKLDEAALASYLAKHAEGFDGPLSVRQFAGGQSNPTYHLSCRGAQWVLRKKPPGELLPTAHAVDREYRIFTALADTDVPVPRTALFCEDANVIGTEFFVMEYVQGRIFWNPALPELTPAQRPAIYDEMNRVMSVLHQVDYEAVGLGDYGKPGNYFGRQIRRWTRQYEAARTDPLPSMDRLMEWLPERVPDDEATCIAHGDYRLDNMIFHPTEPRVLAVLDWELSTLGHPLGDLSYNCMPYHLPTRVLDGQTPALQEIAGPKTGIPAEADYVAAYCKRTGRAPMDNWNFYLAFAVFRYASIVQGVYHRGLQGNASSAGDAVQMRERAVQAADIGWSLADAT